jgi:transposase-like protein
VWAKWRGLVSEQVESGQSVAAFCRDRGLAASQLFAWKKRLREAGALADRSSSVGWEAEGAQFVAVEVAPAEDPAQSSVAGNRAIEVRVRGGRSLMVEPGFDARHLRALLDVLEPGA